MLTDTDIALIIGIALAVMLVAALFIARAARRRRLALKQRFGPEYDREVERLGSVARAERELAARSKRMEKHRLHPLAEADRIRFLGDWRGVQARFVDEPSAAVAAANDLIKSVMLAQGYEIEQFDQRVADLTVDHAAVVQHYRAAHELAEANREGRANTEELRQALVHYRALFSDLLEQPASVQAQIEAARTHP